MDKDFKENIVKSVKEDFKRFREKRKPLELQWRLNMNFLLGNQYAEISPRGDIEENGKQYFWQEREVYNHIAPIVETRLAKLSNVRANTVVRPVTSEDSDIKTAKLSTAILNSITEENQLKAKINEGTLWSEVCGTVFYKVAWNSSKGSRVAKIDSDFIYEGDVDITVCPPYEIYPESLNADLFESQQSIIHAKAYPVRKIKDMWGQEVKAEKVNVFTMDTADILGGLGYTSQIPSVAFDTVENYAIVIEKWEAPTKEFPEGRLIIICGDELLHYSNLPYENGTNCGKTYPFVKQICNNSIGNFFGTSIIERIIPIQRAYNSVKNRKHEFLNRIAMGVVAVEDGSVDLENLEEEGLSPGKVLLYRQGSNPPTMLEMGRIPPDFHLEEESLMNEFVMISGVSELMKMSKTPDNMTSGIAISLLNEQDDTRMSLSTQSIRETTRLISKHIIRLYKQLGTVKRLKRLASANGDIELKYFSNSDLSSDDVVFDSENEILNSQASRKGMVLELLKMGVLQDENGTINKKSKLKILEILGLGNWESIKDIDELHSKKATRENLNIGSGLSVQSIDDDKLHILEHTRFLISEENNLSAEDRDALLAHIEAHQSSENLAIS